MIKNKKGISMPQEFSGWFIWAVIFLVFILVIIFLLKDKLISAIDYFKTLWKFK